jgi:FlaA1/EpsC-like NDP-sugar epimerase
VNRFYKYNYILSLIDKFLSMPRLYKQLTLIFIDLSLLQASILISFSIRLGFWYWPTNDLLFVLLTPFAAIPIFIYFGLYRDIIRFIGLKVIWRVGKAVSLYALIWCLVCFIYLTSSDYSFVESIPRTVVVINVLLTLLFIVGFRVYGRWLLSLFLKKLTSSKQNNVVIYGSGAAGRELSTLLLESNEYQPIGFIDDHIDFHKQSINGIRIYPPSDLESLIQAQDITKVFLAIPSLNRTRRNEIISFLELYPIQVLTLPSISEIVAGNINLSDLLEIGIEDLLGREKVVASDDLLTPNILGKVVLVTGAGGSIGSELCRQIVLLKPKALILYELSEYALYQVDKELKNLNIKHIEIFPILGSVNDKEKLLFIFKEFKVATIYHAAAYKHVPIVELNNSEGVSNNIFGTYNCALSAISSSVETFVLISTDKAVRPTNTMGATKRFAELILQALTTLQDTDSNLLQELTGSIQKNSHTRFIMVRFGNVLGSSGSVIPLFKDQIKAGGPVTVTHKEMHRYFMTVTEAVQLVIQAGTLGNGGDVFVLDMGEPVSILNLAKKMINLSGLEVKDEFNSYGDIEINFTGLRPGEKLYEELLIGDNASVTSNSMIMRAKEEMIAWEELEKIMEKLKIAIKVYDMDAVRNLLLQAVPGFKPQSDLVDILFKKK